LSNDKTAPGVQKFGTWGVGERGTFTKWLSGGRRHKKRSQYPAAKGVLWEFTRKVPFVSDTGERLVHQGKFIGQMNVPRFGKVGETNSSRTLERRKIQNNYLFSLNIRKEESHREKLKGGSVRGGGVSQHITQGTTWGRRPS